MPAGMKANSKNLSDFANGLAEVIVTNPNCRYVFINGTFVAGRYKEPMIEIYSKVFVSNGWVNRYVELGVRIYAESNKFSTFVVSKLETLVP
jgi:hypothetical protein